MKSDVLICIFNYRHDDNARRWYNILSSHFDTYVLDSGNSKVNKDFVQYPNIFYSGLWNKMKALSEQKDYKYVGIICSDVELGGGAESAFIDRINWLLCTKNVGCWTLLGDLNGHSNKHVYTSYKDKRYRTFEGFLQFIKKDVLEHVEYVDTTINLYGHGIDYLTCYVSNLLGYQNVCHEDIYIFHPNDKGYDGKVARLQGALYKSIQRKRYSDYMKEVINYDAMKFEYEYPIEYITDRKCVYTCIIGNYDVLNDVPHTEGWDYICFTDMDIKTETWKIRRIPKELKELSLVKQQRMIKIMPFKYLPDYSETVWIDGNITIKDSKSFCDYYDFCKSINKPIVFKSHPVRKCVYDEMDACISLNKDTRENIDKIRSRYLSEGMPKHDGMYETNIIYRYNYNNDVNRLMSMWADEVRNNSHRDQLSLNYCIWKLKDYNIIGTIDYLKCMSYFNIGYKHTRNNYSVAKIEETVEPIITEEPSADSKAITSTIEPDILSTESKNNGKVLILIEKSQQNRVLNVVRYEFSQKFDTKVIDCRDRDYSSVYRSLSDLSSGYSWVVLIKSNVSFEWSSPKYFESICNKIVSVSNRNSVGIYGLSLMNDYNNSVGGVYEMNIIPKQDQFVMINTKVLEKVPELDFAGNYIGAGFIQYIGNLSHKLGYSTIVDCGLPIKLYSNVENFDNPTIIRYSKEFLEKNKIS